MVFSMNGSFQRVYPFAAGEMLLAFGSRNLDAGWLEVELIGFLQPVSMSEAVGCATAGIVEGVGPRFVFAPEQLRVLLPGVVSSSLILGLLSLPSCFPEIAIKKSLIQGLAQ